MRMHAVCKAEMTSRVDFLINKALGMALWPVVVAKAAVRKDFDESKVTRDHGRFASTGGADHDIASDASRRAKNASAVAHEDTSVDRASSHAHAAVQNRIAAYAQAKVGNEAAAAHHQAQAIEHLRRADGPSFDAKLHEADVSRGIAERADDFAKNGRTKDQKAERFGEASDRYRDAADHAGRAGKEVAPNLEARANLLQGESAKHGGLGSATAPDGAKHPELYDRKSPYFVNQGNKHLAALGSPETWGDKFKERMDLSDRLKARMGRMDANGKAAREANEAIRTLSNYRMLTNYTLSNGEREPTHY